MSTPYFFGYGSLVNRASHTYGQAHPARVTGWRRAWRHAQGRDVAFLTAVRDEKSTIDGLVAEVPNADWSALDAREAWYKREAIKGVRHTLDPEPSIQMYHAPIDMHPLAIRHHPILLSYLDVVVKGYLDEFGNLGVTRFFETTDGWDAPIKNDRSDPIYPRHQSLTEQQTAVVDYHLARINAQIV